MVLEDLNSQQLPAEPLQSPPPQVDTDLSFLRCPQGPPALASDMHASGAVRTLHKVALPGRPGRWDCQPRKGLWYRRTRLCCCFFPALRLLCRPSRDRHLQNPESSLLRCVQASRANMRFPCRPDRPRPPQETPRGRAQQLAFQHRDIFSAAKAGFSRPQE